MLGFRPEVWHQPCLNGVWLLLCTAHVKFLHGRGWSVNKICDLSCRSFIYVLTVVVLVCRRRVDKGNGRLFQDPAFESQGLEISNSILRDAGFCMPLATA